jgi:SAM-dependent methyltransferase
MNDTITEQIRSDYAKAAVNGECLCATNAYEGMDLSFIPDEVRKANQGCASPLAHLTGVQAEGCVIVDLGAGAGLDVFLAARLVGARGRAIGIDMTAEMLSIAERAAPQIATALGYANTEFYLAQIEKLPLEDNTADIVISNCVVNLSTDKGAVFSELFRVLKPGGVFILSDVYAFAPVPQYIQNDAELIKRCIGGAPEYREYFRLAAGAGFRGLRAVESGQYANVDGYDFLSLTVQGVKPQSEAGKSTANKTAMDKSEADKTAADITAADITAADKHATDKTAANKSTADRTAANKSVRYALLTGPMSRVVTEFGTELLRGKPAIVSSEEAALLQMPAYQSYIQISEENLPSCPDMMTRILPEPGPCKYLGEFAVLTGPFVEIEDDDKHVYRMGEPLEICEKTAAVLDNELYKPLVMVMNKAGSRAVGANETDCGDACCC